MFHDDVSDLPYLIRLCPAAGWLEIDDFRNSVLAKHMMAAFYPFLKSQTLKQENEVIKSNILVAAAAQYQARIFSSRPMFTA